MLHHYCQHPVHAQEISFFDTPMLLMMGQPWIHTQVAIDPKIRIFYAIQLFIVFITFLMMVYIIFLDGHENISIKTLVYWLIVTNISNDGFM